MTPYFPVNRGGLSIYVLGRSGIEQSSFGVRLKPARPPNVTELSLCGFRLALIAPVRHETGYEEGGVVERKEAGIERGVVKGRFVDITPEVAWDVAGSTAGPENPDQGSNERSGAG